MAKIYRIHLKQSEREQLNVLVKKGRASQRKLLHARILLKADEAQPGGAWIDQKIAEALEVGVSTVERVRERCVNNGLEAAVEGLPSSRVYERKIDGKAEAQLVTLACGKAPQGHARWTLELLADKMVQLGYLDQVHPCTIQRTLKKMSLSLGSTSSGASHPRPVPHSSAPWRKC